MCEQSRRESAADYAERAERERAYARIEAIRIAHDREQPPESVVARAAAYFAFIAEEGRNGLV